MTFERLMNDYLIDDIDHIFFDVAGIIGHLMDVDRSVQYIDGTKIEADANKYPFVYKTRITQCQNETVYENNACNPIEVNMESGFDFPYRHMYCAQEIGYIAQYLMELMVENDIEPVYGKGKRKKKFKDGMTCFLNII